MTTHLLYSMIFSMQILSKISRENAQFILGTLTHSLPLQSFSTPENIRKPYAFPMFSGCREMVHWEQMG